METILIISEETKKKMLIYVMALTAICLWASVSFADFSKTLHENGEYNGAVYNITKVEIFNLDGSNRDFSNPGIGNFSAGSWTVQMPNADWILATNTMTGTSAFYFTLFFTKNDSGSKLDLAYLAYTSTGEVFGTYLKRNSNSWSFPVITNLNINDPAFNRTGAPVPLPPAVYLFSGGLLGLAFLRKKIRG